MHKFYQRLVILTLVALTISGLVVYFTVDINTLPNLTAFRPWSLCIALFFLAFGLLLDGTRLYHLVKISGEKISKKQILHVVFSNYFLAMLMPGAAGGAVAQVMFLRKAGIPTGKATVLVVARTLMSIAFMLVCMPFVFYFDNDLLPWVSERTLFFVSVAVVVAIFSGVIALRTNMSDMLLIVLTKRLSHNKRRSVFSLYRDIKGAIIMLSTAPRYMMRVFGESALSLLSLYMVAPVLFLGLGASFDWLRIMGRMIFLNLIIYFAPTPGGSGIAEGGFILLFADYLPTGTVGIAAIIWRFFVEYIPFLVGLYYTIKVLGRDFLSKQI